MSTRGELNTLVRLAPEATTTLLSDANLNILFNRAQVDLSLRGRALPKNVKFGSTLNTQEYAVSGASSVVTDTDFLAIDLKSGGLLYNDGTNWIGSSNELGSGGRFEPKTKEWLDRNYPSWRSNAASATPLYWYLDGDGSGNLVVGIVDKPNATTSNKYWLHYLARGKLMTADANYPWTNSTSQLVHLESYELLFVWFALDYIQRIILHNPEEANLYKQIYEAGVVAMSARLPLAEQLSREGFHVPNYFSQFQRYALRS